MDAQTSAEASGETLAGAALPIGRPSRLKRSRNPESFPTRHSSGRIPRLSKKALSCMFAP